MAPFVIDEVTLLGSRCGPFDRALQLLQSGAVRVDPLISARYPLEDAAAAFECAVRKDVLKVLLEVS
jgi:threonine dehydrogenase-like Zn-dependent dehydrogenase